MPKERLVLKLAVLPLVLLGCFTWMNKVLASGYLPPRLSLDANAGGSATVGRADLMLSLKGDTQHNLYLDPQASYGTDEQWYGDLGLGYRGIKNEAAILGAYLFAGHTQVANHSGFWIANPGVEALGSRWDARINGYIPIGGRSDNLGVFQFIQSQRLVFSGHTGSLLTTYVNGNETQQIGDGVDARVGYQVFRNVPFKAYLGAYFFDIPRTDNVRGGAAGLEYWFDHHVKAFANYSYDNLQHSTVVGGLAVSFGGMREDLADPSLSERLTDPVERYLANLGHGSGIPSETLLTNRRRNVKSVLNAGSLNNLINGPSDDTSSEPLLTDVAFFSQTGRPNNGGVRLTMVNCTFENPCGPTDFSQIGVNTLNSLLPNTEMYFNGGMYPASNGSSALTLNNGQSVWGRSANYSVSAIGTARPTFNGAFILSGNNRIDSIFLNNSLGANTTAISSNGGQDIFINNSSIGTVTNPYGLAMNLNDSNATLIESIVNTNASVSVGSSFNNPGIFLSTASLLTVQSSTINLVSSMRNIEGIAVAHGSTLLFFDSQLNVTETLPGGGSSVIGITAQNDANVAINNSTISLSATVPATETIVAGTISGLLTRIVSAESEIEMRGGSLTITADVPFPAASIGSGITIAGDVTCTINGFGC